jgi:hypothetical protein
MNKDKAANSLGFYQMVVARVVPIYSSGGQKVSWTSWEDLSRDVSDHYHLVLKYSFKGPVWIDLFLSLWGTCYANK